MSRAAVRSARRYRYWETLFGVIFRTGLAALIVFGALPFLAPMTSPGSSPPVVAAPVDRKPSHAAEEARRFTPTPTPSETATPELVAPEVPLQSLPATLSIPVAGIVEMPITQFDEARDLKATVSYDANGNPSEPIWVVEPPSMDAIIWHDGNPGGTLTSAATATAPFYCHANTVENPGVCQYLRDVRVGDELILTNPAERLTYQAIIDPTPVPKKDAASDPGFQYNAPQTIMGITCDREGSGGIDLTGHSRDNLYVIFQLVSVEALAP